MSDVLPWTPDDGRFGGLAKNYWQQDTGRIWENLQGAMDNRDGLKESQENPC